MKRISRPSPALPGLLAILVLAVPLAAGRMAFTLSMPRAADHLVHVAFRCEGLRGPVQDFRMPAWMPGYYRIMDYQKNVSGFRAADGAGRPLPWEKVGRNTWRVASDGVPVVVVDYDVFGNVSFPAQNNIDTKRAFIAPPGTFLHLAGALDHPVTVTVLPPPGWTRIASGLESDTGRPWTLRAPDFDVLYDSPILMGTQETRRFEVRGIPHDMAIEDVPETVDRAKMTDDLRKIVEASAALMGDLPYGRYAFLLMGNGVGGIEHANSAACFFGGKGLADPKGYRGWLRFIAHEYFHAFNVKRIRPLALGPFDYESENLTGMLWVSEGLTVYYEDILMMRAGLMTADDYLAGMAGAMTRFENTPGRRYESAVESSERTWSGSGFGGDRKTTISYYDDGAMIGAMLDLAIRNASGNRRSLDDVMRSLYRTYDLRRKRGFTDAEFRGECERAAGRPLAEVFDAAATTKRIDYAKFFALAGLRVEDAATETAAASLGIDTDAVDGGLDVTDAAPGSAAEAAGLRAGDRIRSVDGTAASTKALSDLLAAKKPGETIKLEILRDGAARELTVALGRDVKHDYRIVPAKDPTPGQTAILRDWLRTSH